VIVASFVLGSLASAFTVITRSQTASELVGLDRSTLRYRCRRPDDSFFEKPLVNRVQRSICIRDERLKRST
jgi:hypothetical protein